jgi:hypothetical protein
MCFTTIYHTCFTKKKYYIKNEYLQLFFKSVFDLMMKFDLKYFTGFPSFFIENI